MPANNVLGQLPSPILTVSGSKKTVQAIPIQPASHQLTAFPAVTAAAVLTPAEWYPMIPDHAWQVIVVHHSASDNGGARAFDAAHRARGWDELGYHFVIGNGTGTPDGYIEVGSRWFKQKHGAHCKTPTNYYNDYGIGVCLVGNFDETSPTPRQLQSLRRLVAFLSQRYHIPAGRIYGHGEVRGTSTNCPGKFLSMNDLRFWINYNYSNTFLWASATK